MQFLHEAKSHFSSVTQTLPRLSLSLHIMELTFLLLPTFTFWPIFQNNPVYLLSTTPPPRTCRYLWSDFLQVIVLKVRKLYLSLYFRNFQLKPVTDSPFSSWLVNSRYIVKLIIIMITIIIVINMCWLHKEWHQYPSGGMGGGPGYKCYIRAPQGWGVLC